MKTNRMRGRESISQINSYAESDKRQLYIKIWLSPFPAGIPACFLTSNQGTAFPPASSFDTLEEEVFDGANHGRAGCRRRARGIGSGHRCEDKRILRSRCGWREAADRQSLRRGTSSGIPYSASRNGDLRPARRRREVRTDPFYRWKHFSDGEFFR